MIKNKAGLSTKGPSPCARGPMAVGTGSSKTGQREFVG